MGYARFIRAGDSIETYEYEKTYNKPNKNRAGLTPLEKKRRKDRRALGTQRSSYSCRRARLQFFRLVRANLARTEHLSMITLTTMGGVELTQGYRYIAKFLENVKNKMGIALAYIAVPEWQKRGAIHFHCLVWGLPESTFKERDTRFLQRCWQQGYLDVSRTLYKSPKLPGYLAKYLTKSKGDKRLGNKKAYTCSRSIERPREKGANYLSDYISTIVDLDTISKVTEYETQWLGRARVTHYKGTKENHAS